MSWPANLLSSIQSGDFAGAILWKITRLDATIYGFTDSDVDIPYDDGDGDGEITYLSATGFESTKINKSSSGGVDNLNIGGIFGTTVSTQISKAELYEGKFKGATLTIMIVNREDLTEGDYKIFKGEIGEVVDVGEVFECELISDYMKLNLDVGKMVQPLCNAKFGDSRCGVTIATFTHAGTVNVVTDNKTFTISGAASGKADDYYGVGKITFTSGNNNGLTKWVKSYISDQIITYEAFPNTVVNGDTFNAIAGCRLRALADCKTKFNNLINHRGFPGVPGDKFLIGYVT